MTNMHLNRAARRERLTLSSIQCQALAVYALPGRMRAGVQMPLMVTIRSLLMRGLLEDDSFFAVATGQPREIKFYRLTSLGWEIAHELGALVWADEYAVTVEQAALKAGLTDLRTVYQRAKELYAETGTREHLRALSDAEVALRAWENSLYINGLLYEAGY